MTMMKLTVGALLLVGIAALDVQLQNIQCEDLPIKIDDTENNFKIVCPNSGTEAERCSFNGDQAILSGSCKSRWRGIGST